MSTQRDNLRAIDTWLHSSSSAAVPRKQIAELTQASHIAAFCIHCKETDCEISLDGSCNLIRFYLRKKQETPLI